MKISIDLDGTMWSHMSFFRHFMQVMQAAGHEVGILTGHNQTGEKHDVALMVARGFPVPSFYFGKTGDEGNFNGAVSKTKKILEENIDLHFDDYDYGNQETERLFRQLLGDQFHRLVRVHPKEPTRGEDGHGIHYE